MITGYNTDVKHRGTVFHVQTEDKGLPAAWVETLIFVGGMVVARRKRNYQDLIDGEPNQKVIGKALEEQHRAMIAEIRLGNIDEQFEELAGHAHKSPAAPGSQEIEAPSSVEVSVAEPEVAEPAEPSAEVADAPAEQVPVVPVKEVASEAEPEVEPEADSDVEPVVEAPSQLAAEPSLSLDEVILDYLTTEEEQEHLRLVMDSEDDLVLGSEVKFAFRTVSDPGGRPILGASVLISFISTVAEPLLLAEGQTDKLGVAELSVALPAVSKGKGALIVTAKSPLGNAEIKHLL